MKKRSSVPKKWLLIQTRIAREVGEEIRSIASREGLPTSIYVRRLVIKHLEERRLHSPAPLPMPTMMDVGFASA